VAPKIQTGVTQTQRNIINYPIRHNNCNLIDIHGANISGIVYEIQTFTKFATHLPRYKRLNIFTVLNFQYGNLSTRIPPYNICISEYCWNLQQLRRLNSSKYVNAPQLMNGRPAK